MVVDVLRFTTAVEAANSAGAAVYPWRWGDPGAPERARAVGAELPSQPGRGGPALSPLLLRQRPAGSKVLLASPNGATCSVTAAEAGATVFAACLRNAGAVAGAAAALGRPVTVVAAGERWPDGSLRPALEDLLGAGAVLAELTRRRAGVCSPEAESAAALFGAAASVGDLVRHCASGREMADRGRADEVDYAVDAGASNVVPLLNEGAFRALLP